MPAIEKTKKCCVLHLDFSRNNGEAKWVLFQVQVWPCNVPQSYLNFQIHFAHFMLCVEDEGAFVTQDVNYML